MLMSENGRGGPPTPPVSRRHLWSVARSLPFHLRRSEFIESTCSIVVVHWIRKRIYYFIRSKNYTPCTCKSIYLSIYIIVPTGIYFFNYDWPVGDIYDLHRMFEYTHTRWFYVFVRSCFQSKIRCVLQQYNGLRFFFFF